MAKLLSTAYFPPVSYFAAMAQEMEGLSNRRDGDGSAELSPSVIYLEACENFQKQSYRNRCRFYAADGVQTLSFPIVHEGGTHKQPISEAKVDYSKPWILQHKRAITSAYGTSAYFEYYQDELFAILDSKPERLFDLNLALIRFFIEKTGLCVDLRVTEDYTREAPEGVEDLREVIHPKRPNAILSDLELEKPYFQVFAPKYGFQKDLSIMDLLFNEGPDSILYLKKL
ncbi:MAG: WbqC family protein [Bacteroidales bacterium]|nr:WbqC family protein [Bacteroidales bacterium]MBR0321694.1 WbqC family protein [Bacteroidales bacterium]MBR5809986.1 WbqC family protein [Bacteroidales bacterium]